MHRFKAFWLIASAAVFMACESDRWYADTSSVNYNAKFLRLDSAVFAIEPNSARVMHQGLLGQYGEVYEDYVEDIMRVGDAKNPMTAPLLMRFTTDPTWSGLQGHLNAEFSDLTIYEAYLEQALKRYAVFFGESHLPQLVAYNSGYNIGIYPSDSWLGVGLEWYAGKDHKWVKMLPPDLFPQYKRDKMLPEYMVTNMIRGYLLYHFREMEVQELLLDEMIYEGKMLFLVGVLTEAADEGRMMNYSNAQLTWCQNHEYEVWQNLVERDLIFSTDLIEINKIMNDGPFTPGLPPESPGGIGRWIGYRMVKQYMDKETEMDLPGLLKIDARTILKAYKPDR